MKKISGTTFFVKKAFPLMWFGGLLAYLVVVSFSEPQPKSAIPYVVVIGWMVFWAYIFKITSWRLADKVYDSGDHLVFRRGAKEQVVRLVDIMNISVNSSVMDSVERVTVSVRSGDDIGEELVFVPSGRFIRIKTHPTARDLIVRVDRARRAA